LPNIRLHIHTARAEDRVLKKKNMKNKFLFATALITFLFATPALALTVSPTGPYLAGTTVHFTCADTSHHVAVWPSPHTPISDPAGFVYNGACTGATSFFAGSYTAYETDSGVGTFYSTALPIVFHATTDLVLGTVGTNAVVGPTGTGFGILGLAGTGIHDIGTGALAVIGLALGIIIALVVYGFMKRKAQTSLGLGRPFGKKDFDQYSKM